MANENEELPPTSSGKWTFVKLLLSVGFCFSAYYQLNHQSQSETSNGKDASTNGRRRLLQTQNIEVPSYMQSTMADLEARHALFDNTPPQEIKYWFEYAGPLQVRFIG